MGRKKKEEKELPDTDQDKKSPVSFDVASEVKRGIIAVFLIALGAVIILAFFKKAGIVGEKINYAFGLFLGWGKFVLPAFLIAIGAILFLRKKKSFYLLKSVGLLIILLGVAGIMHWFIDLDQMITLAKAGKGGGYAGLAIAYFLVLYFGKAGSLVIMLALILIGIILVFKFFIFKWVTNIWNKEKNKEDVSEDMIGAQATNEIKLLEKKTNELLLGKPAEKLPEDNIKNIRFDDEIDQTSISDNEISKIINKNKKKRKKLEFDSESEDLVWRLPSLNLLVKSSDDPKVGNVQDSQRIIKETFSHFSIDVKEEEIRIGPSVTQYSFRPKEGIKISSIVALQDNLALSLAAHPIRIEAPIPGKSLIGVEVPNKTASMVRLRNILESPKFTERDSDLTLALGKDVNNEFMFADMDKMPHLLIAGATNTGKSVCINSIITALLYQNSPDNLKFLMVDPKRVELSRYNGIDHLLSPVIVESNKVVNMLKWAVGEMERRYRMLQDFGSLNINSYNEKAESGKKKKYTDPKTGETIEEEIKKLPFIIIVIDELAELMSSHGKEVEGAIIRLAQMARAVGIHLIVSTQRPEVRVITGLIKANITHRIAFRVATQVDSRTILDMSGAEKLLGNGDMLYISPSSPKPKRIQGVFISEEEVKKVVKFVQSQKKKETDKNIEIIEDTSHDHLDFSRTESEDESDEYFEAAKEEVQRSGKASASFLQRRLRIGYPKAARLLDILENKGIIGPADGNKPREVYNLNNRFSDSLEKTEENEKWNFE
jgi:S-DNA-T family DNA segregation ATPase FtsK/SpoIIIE